MNWKHKMDKGINGLGIVCQLYAKEWMNSIPRNKIGRDSVQRV